MSPKVYLLGLDDLTKKTILNHGIGKELGAAIVLG